MKRLALILALVLLPSLAYAQALGGGGGSGGASNGIATKTFASLGTEADGTLYYCSDCNKVIPCTGGGSGAYAFGYGGQWQCTSPQGTPFATNIGGTGTASTLTGLVRGGAAYTAAELSGDVTTSGSNATQVTATHLAAALPLAQGGTSATTAYAAYQALATVNDQGTQASVVTCDFTVAPICRWNGTSNNITLTVTNLPTNQWVMFVHVANGHKSLVTGANVLGMSASGGAIWQNSQTYDVYSGDNTFIGWSDGTNLYLYVTGGTNVNAATLAANLAKLSTLSVGGDNNVTSMARMPLQFNEGTETGLTANESIGSYKTPKAITIENIVADIRISPTCAVSEVITCYDCGTTAGACTASQTATISTTTIANGATRQTVDQTVSTANVAAAHYISCLITAGTCTLSNNSISMMARPQ